MAEEGENEGSQSALEEKTEEGGGKNKGLKDN